MALHHVARISQRSSGVLAIARGAAVRRVSARCLGGSMPLLRGPCRRPPEIRMESRHLWKWDVSQLAKATEWSLVMARSSGGASSWDGVERGCKKTLWARHVVIQERRHSR